MRRPMLFAAGVIAAAAVTAGCSGGGGGGGGAGGVLGGLPPAAIDTSANVLFFAESGSAPKMFYSSLVPYLLVSVGGDASCPHQQVSGSTVTYTGGCTSTNGATYSGTMSVTTVTLATGVSIADGGIHYSGWKIATTQTCGGASYTGDVDFDGSLNTHAGGGWNVDLVETVLGIDSACTAASYQAAYSYTGTLASQSTGQITTWNGSGTLGFKGAPGVADGKVSAATQDEIIDQTVCSEEAKSGTTTLTSGSHTAVLTYDGATACDGNVPWSYDGTPKGTLTGIDCDVAESSGGPAAIAGALGVAAATLALARARRRRASR